MNQKTEADIPSDQKRPKEFARGFILTICLLTLMSLVGIYFVEHKVVGRVFSYTRDQFDLSAPLVYPWAVVNQYAVNSFMQPGIPSHISSRLESGLVAGIVLTFLICPTVFLFSWRKRRLDQLNPEYVRVSRPLDGSSLAYTFSGVVTFYIAFTIVPAAFVQERSYNARCASDASQSTRYAIEIELSWIDRNAMQYHLIPRELGGGGGSYIGYTIPETMAKTDNGNFTSKLEADTLNIRGVSAKCATNAIVHRINNKGTVVAVIREGEWLGGG
jgi:hypothetical protein